MITISISGRLLDAVYALVASMAPEAAPEAAPETIPEAVAAPETAPAVVPKAVEEPGVRSHQAAAKATEPVAADRARKKADPHEHVAVTRPDALVEPIRPVETPLDTIRPVETPAPVVLEGEWPTTLTKPSDWDYDGQGASWRAANQIGTAELGAAIQRVYIDHADIIKMPSVRVAMSKLGVEGWWRCVAKNIAEARDASNRPLDITPKREAKND